jgi:hypothetical protein
MMPNVRTILTLDDDLAELLKERARDLGIPLKKAVNRTIRAGMGEATASRRHPAPKTISHSFGFRPGYRSRQTRAAGRRVGGGGVWGKKFMILPDVNVLVHAHNADSALHKRASL